MAQYDYDMPDQGGAGFLAELNLALMAIATQNAGPSAPSPTYPFQPWPDETNNLLKVRNAANSDWITIGRFSGTTWIPYHDGNELEISTLSRALLGDTTSAQIRARIGAVNIAGDTMTGFLTLHGAPTSALHAATKAYVDGIGEGIADAFFAVAVATAQNIRSLNIASTVDLGTGNTQANYAVPMVDGNYQVSLGYDADVPVTVTGAPRIMDAPIRNASAMTVQCAGMSVQPGVSGPLDFTRAFAEINGG